MSNLLQLYILVAQTFSLLRTTIWIKRLGHQFWDVNDHPGNLISKSQKINQPSWLKIPWPVSNSVLKPMMKPIIARRPFKVSAKLTKPKRDCVLSFMIEVRRRGMPHGGEALFLMISLRQQKCCTELPASSLALDQAFLPPELLRERTSGLR